MGTNESTAAPPFVMTFTICSSDLVFLIPDVASFLSATFLSVDVLTGAPRLGDGSFFGESAFFVDEALTPLRGVIFRAGAFGGVTLAATFGAGSAFTAFPAFPFGTIFYGVLALIAFLGEGGADTDREFFLLSLLFEVAGSAFLA